MTAILQFADGVAASLTYSGYDHFDTDEFHDWVGESGAQRKASHGSARRALHAFASPAEEARGRTASGFSGSGIARSNGPMHHPHFGLLIVSCEGADLRPSPAGVLVYDEDGVREIRAPAARAYPNKDGVIDELYAAVMTGTPPLHDGRWGSDTMAASLALLQSAKERRPIALAHEERPHAIR